MTSSNDFTNVANVNDLISAKHDLLLKFATEFSSKQADVQTTYATVQSLIASSLEDENAETANLSQLQKQLDGLSLTSTLAGLQNIQSDLNNKFSVYTTIVQANNKTASDLFDKLSASQDMINNIMKLVDDINANMTTIKSTITQYDSVKAIVTVAQVIPVIAADVVQASTVV